MNKIEFGVLLPVSGIAKQLKPHTQFSSVTWRTALLSGSFFDKESLQVYFILISTIIVLLNWRRLTAGVRVVILPVVLFPVVYLTALSFLSDWMPNDWYMYIWRPALCIVLAFWFSRQGLRRWSRSTVVTVCLLGVSLLALAANTWHAQDDQRYTDAIAFHHFALTHPGVYAMGDYGGEPGYMLGRPLVQTEGLMMDRDFLNRIQRREDLISVLSAYHVRYYIANTRKGYTGCFHAVEPLRGGPASPKMSAEFCQKPVADLHDVGNDFVIFDLQKN